MVPLQAISIGSRKWFCIAWIAMAALGSIASPALGQLRIVDYNTAGGPRAGMSTILEAIGEEAVNGIAKPLDVLILQEQSSSASTTQAIVDVLNTIYGGGYARATLDGVTSGAGRPGLIYNTNTVQLIDQIAFGTVNTSAQARQTLRYELRPVGYDSSADFYVYANHYKASDTSSDAARRNVEATALRANSDALGEGTHAIYAGDFNIYRSSEPMWATLTGAGAGQAFDPLNRVGSWHDSSSFRDVHTQSPTNTSRYGGQVTGGMDDRFDWQMVTGEFLDNEGLAYISGSYHAFGNNGTHPLNGNIGDPSNTALLGSFSPAEQDAILTALASNSDHLPVVADYQIPAKLGSAGVSVANATNIIRGASAFVDVTVSNTASVVASTGADELDYTVVGFGAVAGGAAGSDTALGGGNVHQLALDTLSAAGAKAGAVNVVSDSQGVADGNIFKNVNYNLLDHANASFSSLADLDHLELDFGIFARGTGIFSESHAISNLIDTASFTAGLDLDSILGSGDTSVLSTTLTTFSGLSAGSSQAFDALVDTASTGLFDASYSLAVSDANLLGAMSLGSLILDLTARVALGGDTNLDGKVSISDFAAFQAHLGSTGAWADGDFNRDGKISISDFAMLQSNFGQSEVMSAAIPVPEPGTLLLFGVGVCVAALIRGKKRPYNG